MNVKIYAWAGNETSSSGKWNLLENLFSYKILKHEILWCANGKEDIWDCQSCEMRYFAREILS